MVDIELRQSFDRAPSIAPSSRAPYRALVELYVESRVELLSILLAKCSFSLKTAIPMVD